MSSRGRASAAGAYLPGSPGPPEGNPSGTRRLRRQPKGPDMLLSTMNDLPGYEITEVLGEVFGITIRARNVGSQFGAGLKSIVGGELKGMTKMLVDSRLQAQQRLIEAAQEKGADAVLAMRFDASEYQIGQEICAYGTAVKISKLGAPASAG
jgi:uncharacterized protein YbjQ (UPF0145 family)